MPTTITFIGHATFLLENGGHRVLIDPYITSNPAATCKPEDIDCQTIVLTHGHFDHVEDVLPIAKRTGATVYAPFELCDLLVADGLAENQAVKCNPGKAPTDFGYIALTPAFHSSSYKGQYAGMPFGVVVHFTEDSGITGPFEGRGGFTFYHCGDTGLFSDMKLIGEMHQPHVAAIPVGGRLTMGPTAGRRAAEYVKPLVAIPMHYGTWPDLITDISAFTPDGVEVKVMQGGESWIYEG